MFERFTSAARATVIGAQHEARELRHRHIGTEHVLLSILELDSDGPAGRALRDCGVRPETFPALQAVVDGDEEVLPEESAARTGAASRWKRRLACSRGTGHSSSSGAPPAAT